MRPDFLSAQAPTGEGKSLKYLLMVMVLLFSVPASADGDSAENIARNLAATCANCHGTDGHGQSGSAMPVLAGVAKEKTLVILREFRAGARPATIMHQITRGYGDAQLELVAAWFAEKN